MNPTTAIYIVVGVLALINVVAALQSRFACIRPVSDDEKFRAMRKWSFYQFFYIRQLLTPLSTVIYHFGGFHYIDVFVFGFRICRFHKNA